MSLFKKVMKAVKKLFKATVKRRAPKKRVKKAAHKVKRLKPARPIRPAKSRPKPVVKTPQKKPIAVKKVASGPKTPKVQPKSPGLLVGEVTHYFDRIKVCVIRIDRDHIKKGDRLLIVGPKGESIQNVSSMQIENEDVTSAKKGQLIGLKVSKPVFVKDAVYKKEQA
jgi:hypothetical protein